MLVFRNPEHLKRCQSQANQAVAGYWGDQLVYALRARDVETAVLYARRAAHHALVSLRNRAPAGQPQA